MTVRKGQVEDGSWAGRSRRIIAELLAALPPGTTYAERKKALSVGYPFGERARLPYKAWLAETRLALRPWAPQPPSPRLAAGEVGRPCCGWCGNRIRCLVCAAAKDEYDRLVQTDTDARRVVQDTEPDDRPVMADWLSERGYDALASVWRTGS